MLIRSGKTMTKDSWDIVEQKLDLIIEKVNNIKIYETNRLYQFPRNIIRDDSYMIISIVIPVIISIVLSVIYVRFKFF